MMYPATLETYEQLTSEQMGVEQLPMPIERRLPAAPFPVEMLEQGFFVGLRPTPCSARGQPPSEITFLPASHNAYHPMSEG